MRQGDVDSIITHVDGVEVTVKNANAALAATRGPDRTFTIRVKNKDPDGISTDCSSDSLAKDPDGISADYSSDSGDSAPDWKEGGSGDPAQGDLAPEVAEVEDYTPRLCACPLWGAVAAAMSSARRPLEAWSARCVPIRAEPAR
jgi:hypothetical protein